MWIKSGGLGRGSLPHVEVQAAHTPLCETENVDRGGSGRASQEVGLAHGIPKASPAQRIAALIHKPILISTFSQILSLLLATPAPAQCCGCATMPEVMGVGRVVTKSINTFTEAAVLTSTIDMVAAIQGNAAEISANLRGAMVGQGMIAEAASNQDTQRLIQGDRVVAAKANQFSTLLCQGATGASIAVTQQAEAMPATILRSRANAMRSAGYQRPENSLPTSQTAAANFAERRPLFCDPHDPACRGAAGQRPQGDRMPGAMIALSSFATPTDRSQAAWIVQNLTQPVPVPALTARQVDQHGGREAYLSRGGDEAKLNLAKDLVTDILLTRREPTAHPGWYNSLATDAGLPTAPGGVSMEDMDRMRFRDRFTAAYSTRLAGLGDQAPLLREWAQLEADMSAQRFRTNQLLEQDNMLNAAVLSTIVQHRLHQAAGAQE